MMLFSRNTILTTFVLVVSTVATVEAFECSDVNCNTAKAGDTCCYLQDCIIGNQQLICNAKGDGIPGNQTGFTAEQKGQGIFKQRTIVKEADDESNVDDVDVGAAASVEAKTSSGVTTTSNLLLAAVGATAAAAGIVGL